MYLTRPSLVLLSSSNKIQTNWHILACLTSPPVSFPIPLHSLSSGHNAFLLFLKQTMPSCIWKSLHCLRGSSPKCLGGLFLHFIYILCRFYSWKILTKPCTYSCPHLGSELALIYFPIMIIPSDQTSCVPHLLFELYILKNIYLCVYLAVSGLICSTSHLLLYHAGSLIMVHQLSSCGTHTPECADSGTPWYVGPLLPDQRLNPAPCIARPSGKSGWALYLMRQYPHIVGEGNGNPFLYSCLENPMDRGAWQVTVHGITKSPTQLRDWAHSYIVSIFVCYCYSNESLQS